jgi:hypothetical protein
MTVHESDVFKKLNTTLEEIRVLAGCIPVAECGCVTYDT